MSYKISFPPETLHALWQLREYAGQPAISIQVRNAVSGYLRQKEAEMGSTIEDVAEAIDLHDRDKKSHR